MSLFGLNDAAVAVTLRTVLASGVAAIVLTGGVAEAAMPGYGYYWPVERPMVQRPVGPAPVARRSAARKPAVKSTAKPLQAPIIAVSIARQRITVYDQGVAVASAPVSTGTRSRPTPTGIFSVIQKRKVHFSNLYGAAPMPYMQRITWSGVALHAGPLPGYAASHGCIRMPRDFAVRLWSMTRAGARVIVARNEVAPQDIAHPSLFVLTKSPELSQRDPAVVVAAGGNSLASDAVPAAATAVAPPKPAAMPADAVQPVLADKPLRSGPVSVFVSRKEGKLFVRKGFAPVFEMPVTIARADTAIGTHVFTASDLLEDGARFRWLVVSMPAAAPHASADRHGANKTTKAKSAKPAAAPPQPQPSAAEALDRVGFPADAVARISQMMSPGASLIISDKGLGPETGLETDFIVLTR